MVLEILTGILVIITGTYAWATFKILKANENVVNAMREESLAIRRPYIIVAPVLEYDNPVFYLRITNTGKTSAENLKLSIDKSFFRFGNKKKDNDLATFSAFNNTIDSFPPGAEIIFSLAQAFKVFKNNNEDSNLPQTFIVKASYEYSGLMFDEENRIDLRPYINADIPQNAQIRKLRDIIESLRKISESLSRKS